VHQLLRAFPLQVVKGMKSAYDFEALKVSLTERLMHIFSRGFD
jgi:hypothetical protein